MNLKNSEETKTFKSAIIRIVLFIFLLNIIVLAVQAVGLLTKTQAELPPVEDLTEITTAVETEPLPILLEDPILFQGIVYSPCYDETISNKLIKDAEDAIKVLTMNTQSGEYTTEAVAAMESEKIRLIEVADKAAAEQALIESWRAEYYYATETWLFLKQHGYSDVVASAIIGNMMIETSGGSLALKPTIYSSGRWFYGLCQWSRKYHPKAIGITFEEQLEYLHNDMPGEFKAFGGVCYKRGFTFEDFLAMDDPATAAYAFAKIYERCGSGSYGARKQAAVKAYEYFTLPI